MHHKKYLSPIPRSQGVKFQTNMNIHCGISEYTDNVRPHTLRSGLSALGSGGLSFEEGA